MGVLNTPDHQIYLGLVDGISLCLGLDIVNFSVFYFMLSLFVGEIWFFLTFHNPNLGLKKMIQYAPCCSEINTINYSINPLNSTIHGLNHGNLSKR